MTRKPVPVLMYHALADAHGACPGADPHYAVTPATLARHLGLLAEAGLRARAVRDLVGEAGAEGCVGLTFDDGHASNAAAARAILDAGGGADLFVNASLVGTRHHLGWEDLAGLAREGISIQSHGHTHRYLDELTAAEVEDELARSKGEIEARLGRAVTLFAPPGGRLTPRVATVARGLGYRAICSSRAALWEAHAAGWEIPRLAALAATGEERFRRWIAGDRWEMARVALRHRVLATARGVLGNGGYERLRAGLLAAIPGRERGR